jgi:hypothetical protein
MCPLIHRNLLIRENQLEPLDTGYLIVSYSRPLLTVTYGCTLDSLFSSYRLLLGAFCTLLLQYMYRKCSKS